MNFDLTMEDYTIILNALHYYKKVEKYPNFSHFDEERINKLRDKLAYQLIPSRNSNPDDESRSTVRQNRNANSMVPRCYGVLSCVCSYHRNVPCP